MNERSDRRGMAVALAALGVLGVSGLAGCDGSRRTRSMSEHDRQRAAELGLSAEAEDPTMQDRRAGYGIWREAPQPEGTRAPEAPERRSVPWD